MGSTRFPCKMVAPLHGRPLITYSIEYALRLGVDDVVLATSEREENEPLALWAERYGALVVRGSEASVVSRFLRAVDTTGADRIVRICGGAPLQSIDLGRQLLEASGGYAAYRSSTGWPVIQTHLGIAPEVFSAELLHSVARGGCSRQTHEHVTYEMYASGGEQANLLPLPDDIELLCRSIDTPEHLAAVETHGGYQLPNINKPYMGFIYPEGTPTWQQQRSQEVAAGR